MAIYSTTVKPSLPPKYKDYRDIFSPTEYMKIAGNPQIRYTINLIENIITFYRPIYQFFEKKLRVFREYLEESYQKKKFFLELKIIN
jgi:hypothetical protein